MGGIDRALRVVAPVAVLHAHVLDVLRAIVRIEHEANLARVLGARDTGAFVEIDHAIGAAMDRGGIEVGAARLSLYLRGRLLDPSVALSGLGQHKRGTIKNCGDPRRG